MSVPTGEHLYIWHLKSAFFLLYGFGKTPFLAQKIWLQKPIFFTIFLLLGHCEGRNRKLKDFGPAKVFQQQPKIVHPIKNRQSAAEHINEKVNEKKMGEVITHLMGSSSFTDKMVCLPSSFFAGPKCLQPPNPCSLPRPPMNWIVV